ncbi:purine and uridine phosphorylase [Trichoderma austrokoningii]
MDRSKYTVGWICALSEEFVAARAFLETHERPKDLNPKDTNNYALGEMSDHNIVIACLPLGGYGTVSAAGIAINMVRSFPNIRISFMVGISGGTPSKQHDIQLSNAVVSTPSGGNGGTKELVETALQALKSTDQLEGHKLFKDVERIIQDKPRLRKTNYPSDKDEDDQAIRYGLDASGNQEMCFCFEMEAAGFMNRFPCLVIRGICDYRIH